MLTTANAIHVDDHSSTERLALAGRCAASTLIPEVFPNNSGGAVPAS